MGIIHFETFLLAGILLNITPGNDTIFILSKSIAQGRRAGIVSVLGIGTGSLLHTTLAAFGLSMIIARSVLLFNVVKYAGAAYLLYIGYKMLTDQSGLPTSNTAANQQDVNYLKTYRDALLTNILNPKVALFFIAFLPQFIDPAFRENAVPFLLLGLCFTITGTIWCLTLAIFADFLFSKLKTDHLAVKRINQLCGTVLIGLGIRVALEKV